MNKTLKKKINKKQEKGGAKVRKIKKVNTSKRPSEGEKEGKNKKYNECKSEKEESKGKREIDKSIPT